MLLLLLVVVVLLLPVSLEGLRQLYLAGTFPINGSDGWQGGQVSPANQSECTLHGRRPIRMQSRQNDANQSEYRVDKTTPNWYAFCPTQLKKTDSLNKSRACHGWSIQSSALIILFLNNPLP